MAALTTRADIRDKTAKHKVLIWKSIALATGDTLKTGLKQVFSVNLSKPAAFTSWTDASGTVTFTLASSTTGPLVIIGR